MARRRGGIPSLSFSWKRARGLSIANGRLSRTIGIPLTHSGRQRKAARATGCMVLIASSVATLIALRRPARIL